MPTLKPVCDAIAAGFQDFSNSCSAGRTDFGKEIANLGSAFYAKALVPAGQNIKTAAVKTALFVRHKWDALLAYLFAWGLIVTCTGLMYGFEAVALPLTIGLSGGLAAGIISGILTVKLNSKFTLWQGLNSILNPLDSNTRQVVFSVAVTVLLAAAVVFPYVIGAGFGILIGNQLAVQVGHFDPENEAQPKIEIVEMDKSNTEELASLKTEVVQLKARLEALENRIKV